MDGRTAMTQPGIRAIRDHAPASSGLYTAAGGWDVARSLFGTVRLRITSTRSGTPVFVGIDPAGARQAPEPVSGRADLAQAVRDRMAFWSLLAESQQRPFDVHAPSRRVLVGLDRDELDAAIDALLSNVFAHTPEGTPFRVQLKRAAATAHSWSLIVEDQGTGTHPQLAGHTALRGAPDSGLTSSGEQPNTQAGQPRSRAAKAAATGSRSGFPSLPRQPDQPQTQRRKRPHSGAPSRHLRIRHSNTRLFHPQRSSKEHPAMRGPQTKRW
jgi:hypothetical protein